MVQERAQDILAIAPENSEGATFLAAAPSALSGSSTATEGPSPAAPSASHSPVQPISFANGRYGVKRFLDEGGKKKIYLAQDTLLDREVAFALIKTEGLDEVYRTRIPHEAKPWDGSAPCYGN